jgi:hypothetical protein
MKYQSMQEGSHVVKGNRAPEPGCRTRHIFQRIACLALFVAVSIVPVLAQNTTADVVGTATDASGAVLSGATVVLTDVNTHDQHTATSGGAGEFTFTLIKPGTYSLTVTAPGFKTFKVDSFNVAAGDRAREDARLEVGSTGETVSVEAAPPQLHTDTSAIITTVTEQATQELPLNGRNYINLVQVTPGATEGLNNGLGSGNRPDDRRQTSSVSVNGQSDVINNQLIDGMDNNERVIGTIGVHPSVDAIEEVSIQTNVYTAEVGRTAGAAINVLTKSGTNRVHGTAYEFFRNDVLNAYPYQFGAHLPKPAYKQNQFGGSLGGPIRRDKTFFFADYEGLDIVRNLNPTTTTVPTLFERQNPGNFSDNTSETFKTVSKIDSVAQQYFNLFPLPTNNTLTSGNYIGTPRNTQFNKTADGRIDNRFGNGDLAFLRYTYNATTTGIGGLFPVVNTAAAGAVSPGGNLSSYAGPAQANAHQVQLNYVHSFTPNMLLELKAGYTYLNNAQDPLNFGKKINALFGQPNINVDARTSELSPVTVSQGTASTLGAHPPIVYHENTYEYEGILSWIFGKQSFKFGAGVIRRQDGVTQTDSASGTWTFTDYSTLLSGIWNAAGRNEILYTPHNFTWEPHFFVQDDYHPTPKLTINAGIRYDLFTPYTEKNNILSNFDSIRGIIVVAGVNTNGHGGIQVDYTNVAPRFGFAYTPYEKTVIRGGFGMTFAPENQTSGAAMVNQPFTATEGTYTQSVNATTGAVTGSAPAGYGAFAQGLPIPPPNSYTNPSGAVTAAEYPHFRSTYLEQFNLTVEHEFGGFVGSLGYVGELGRRIAYYLSDYNTLAPESFIYANPNDLTTSNPGLSSAIDPNFNIPYSQSYNFYRRYHSTAPNVTGIPFWTSSGISNYNAMQALLRRRFNKGLDLQVGYTFSRLLDDAEAVSNDGGSGFGTYQEMIPTIDYGNGNLDVRHRVTGTFNYLLPFGQNLHGIAAVLGKGWQGNGLIVWSTGMPFSVINQYDRTGTRPTATSADRPNMLGSPKAAHRTINSWFNINDFEYQKLGTFGTERRGQLFGPGLQRVDLSVFKTFDLYEDFKLEFRTEAFNVLNTAQFVAPNATLQLNPCTTGCTYPISGFQPVSTFGEITSTANAYNPRIIQFAARLKF